MTKRIFALFLALIMCLSICACSEDEDTGRKSKKTDSNRQTEVGLVENQVKPKVVKLVNVLRLAVNGCEWDRLATAPDAESTVAMAFSAQ